MTEQLCEDLGLPYIGGQIIAFFNRKRFGIEGIKSLLKQKEDGSITEEECQQRLIDLRDNSRRENYFLDWKIKLVLRGPDARYNDGVAELNPDKVIELVYGLQEANGIIRKLKDQAFSGMFTKKVGTLRNPSLEVVAEASTVNLRFWVYSGTWGFYKLFDIDDVGRAISALDRSLNRGEEMTKTLALLSA